MASTTVFPQGVGYGIVVGIGFFFALLMMFMSYIQVRTPTLVHGKLPG
jgi:xanthine/uracil/vitamin C permease (AzgA family)